MILLEVTTIPSSSITDWVQAIGVLLGVPVAVWSIIKLFLKDKQKEHELTTLKDIAKSQNSLIGRINEQIDELKKQTLQFTYQSDHLNEANQILREQIKIQTEAFLHDKDYKKKLLKLENLKRKSEIKPFFKIKEYTNKLKPEIDLINLGNDAYNVRIQTSDSLDKKISDLIERRKDLKFSVVTETSDEYSHLVRNIPLEFTILFEDVDKNRYKQIISIHDMNYSISEPVEIEQLLPTP